MLLDLEGVEDAGIPPLPDFEGGKVEGGSPVMKCILGVGIQY